MKSILDDLCPETKKYVDYRGDPHKITAKTLVVVGEKDWIGPPAE